MSESGETKHGVNEALRLETRKVMRQRGVRGRDWSIGKAELATGVNQATIYNLKLGKKSVKLQNVLQFARAVAPKGMEDAVEQRWLQIYSHGKTDLPEVDYALNRKFHVGEDGEPIGPREVTDPRLIEVLDNLEKLPEPFIDSIIQTIKEAANFASSRGSRNRNRHDEPLSAVAAQ